MSMTAPESSQSASNVQLSKCNTLVFGPAYLDNVVRINTPIVPDRSRIIDIGANGRWTPDASGAIDIFDVDGGRLTIKLPNEQNAISGRYEIQGVLPNDFFPNCIVADQIDSDLGGMGAGYAAALQARLVYCRGNSEDPITERVKSCLDQYAIENQSVVVSHCNSDWTLLISSGNYGDKMPIGMRGCHDSATVKSLLAAAAIQSPEVVVVASLRNDLMRDLLKFYKNSIRVLAPAIRNCREQAVLLSQCALDCELLTLNEAEWAMLGPSNQQQFMASNAIICVTQGPSGTTINWRVSTGERHFYHEPAFPRTVPPNDTNRAGEAFGSAFLKSLLQSGWCRAYNQPDLEMIQRAARLASVTAGLTINITSFGFPSDDQTRSAIANGMIS